jgi:hypothetical protein
MYSYYVSHLSIVLWQIKIVLFSLFCPLLTKVKNRLLKSDWLQAFLSRRIRFQQEFSSLFYEHKTVAVFLRGWRSPWEKRCSKHIRGSKAPFFISLERKCKKNSRRGGGRRTTALLNLPVTGNGIARAIWKGPPKLHTSTDDIMFSPYNCEKSTLAKTWLVETKKRLINQILESDFSIILRTKYNVVHVAHWIWKGPAHVA